MDERRMLRIVDEWGLLEEETIPANRLASLLGSGEEDPERYAHQLKQFEALVNQGLIDAKLGPSPDGPLPFGWVKVRGLTPLGLDLIQ